MRIRIAVCAFVISCLVGISAARAQEFSGGIKGGLNFATISNADQTFGPAAPLQIVTGSEGTPRFVAGGFVTVWFTHVLAIQPEGLYSMQGIKGVSGGKADISSQAHIDEIQIPVLFRIGHRTGLFFMTGPEFGIVRKASLQIAGSPDVDIKPSLKSWDASIVVGAGATFSWFLAEARFAAGLVDINNPDAPLANKNQVFSVMVGFQF